jgi:hypothetical protein
LAGLIIATQAMAGVALAQQPYIYPERGQSPEQQARDKNECAGWAMQQTGYRPGAPPPPPSSAPPQGGVVRGGARGAALGAVGGAIAGDAGKGAAIGAATGALFGGMRRADQRRAEAAQQQAYSTQAAQGQAEFNRAMGACLAGRGYTVR